MKRNAIQVLENHGRTLVEQQEALARVLRQSFPLPLERLMAFFNRHGAFNDRMSFPRDSRLFQYLTSHSRLVTMLLDIADQQHSFDPLKYPDLLCIAPEDPAAVREESTSGSPRSFVVYLRMRRTTAGVALQESFKLLENFPAYTASEAVVSRALSSLAPSEHAIRIYGGITGRDITGVDRLNEDVPDDGDKARTRFAAFTTINDLKHEIKVYHLHLDNSSGMWSIDPSAASLAIALRGHQDIQLLESLLIAVLRTTALNIALGGVYEFSRPQEEFFVLRDAVLSNNLFARAAVCRALDDARPQITRRKVRRRLEDGPGSSLSADTTSEPVLLEDERRKLEQDTRLAISARVRALVNYWDSRGDGGDRMSAACMETVIKIASAISLTDDGYVEMVRVLCDSPKEAHRHEQVSFWSPLTGQSAHFTRQLLVHVRGLDSEHLNARLLGTADTDAIAPAFGAQVNLWDVIIAHDAVAAALTLLVTGLLQWWNSPCFMLVSAQVCMIAFSETSNKITLTPHSSRMPHISSTTI